MPVVASVWVGQSVAFETACWSVCNCVRTVKGKRL